MGDPERLNGELNDLLGRLLDQRADDHESYLREREALALLVVGVERHVDALGVLVEQAKTRIAGITPSGRPA